MITGGSSFRHLSPHSVQVCPWHSWHAWLRDLAHPSSSFPICFEYSCCMVFHAQRVGIIAAGSEPSAARTRTRREVSVRPKRAVCTKPRNTHTQHNAYDSYSKTCQKNQKYKHKKKEERGGGGGGGIDKKKGKTMLCYFFEQTKLRERPPPSNRRTFVPSSRKYNNQSCNNCVTGVMVQ